MILHEVLYELYALDKFDNDVLRDCEILVHIKESAGCRFCGNDGFFEIEGIEVAQDGSGNIHILVVENADKKEADKTFDGIPFIEIPGNLTRSELLAKLTSSEGLIVQRASDIYVTDIQKLPEKLTPLQLKLIPPEGFEYCWIEQIKLCPRGIVIGDRLEPHGPLQLPGTHWKSVSNNRHPELAQYWTFSTMTPNLDVPVIKHYLYKDLILCERKIEDRKHEQDEYNEHLKSFKTIGMIEGGYVGKADVEAILDHPLLADETREKAKLLEPLLANVDPILKPLMDNLPELAKEYEAELKRQRVLTRDEEYRIAERLFEMLKRD